MAALILYLCIRYRR